MSTNSSAGDAAISFFQNSYDSSVSNSTVQSFAYITLTLEDNSDL